MFKTNDSVFLSVAVPCVAYIASALEGVAQRWLERYTLVEYVGAMRRLAYYVQGWIREFATPDMREVLQVTFRRTMVEPYVIDGRLLSLGGRGHTFEELLEQGHAKGGAFTHALKVLELAALAPGCAALLPAMAKCYRRFCHRQCSDLHAAAPARASEADHSKEDGTAANVLASGATTSKAPAPKRARRSSSDESDKAQKRRLSVQGQGASSEEASGKPASKRTRKEDAEEGTAAPGSATSPNRGSFIAQVVQLYSTLTAELHVWPENVRKLFQHELNHEFEQLVNKTTRCDAAKALADLFDERLRLAGTVDCGGGSSSGAEASGNGDVMPTLRTAAKLLALVWNKDHFGAQYSSLLQGRLLDPRDVYDFHSEGVKVRENEVLALLHASTTTLFTAPMQRMMDDVLSAEAESVCRDFQTDLRERERGTSTEQSEGAPVSVSVQTLSRRVWSEALHTSGAAAAVVPDGSLRSLADRYEKFYASRYKDREVTHHWHLTRVALKASFPSPQQPKKKVQYELHMTGVQAAVLGAFTAKRRKGLTLEDFARACGLPANPLREEHAQFLRCVLATFTFQNYKTQGDVPAGCLRTHPLVLVRRRATTPVACSRAAPNCLVSDNWSAGATSGALSAEASVNSSGSSSSGSGDGGTTYALYKKFKTAGQRRVVFHAPEVAAAASPKVMNKVSCCAASRCPASISERVACVET